MTPPRIETEVPPRLDLAKDLARRAGDLLRSGVGRATAEAKGPLELVTEFDRASEALIVGAIRAAFPDDAIVAEEGGGHPGTGWTWFIDPLDGTTNFAHGLPIFAVSIAGVRSGVVAFGAIYDPTRDEMFHAARNQGAFLGDHRLRVSTANHLAESLLVTGFPYDLRQNPDNNLDRFTALSRQTRAVRRLGSASLDLAYVAAGRFDGYWEIRLSAWDMAAGILLVEEAGGMVTRIDGGPDPLRPPTSIAATNGRIHAALLDALQRVG